MKTEDVKKLSPLERFLYMARERHQVYLKKRRGMSAPWSDDEILQSVFFTNVYRELDKTTAWFRENIRDPLRDEPEVIFATIAFRWFNYIPTGEALMDGPMVTLDSSEGNMFVNWDTEEVLRRLREVRDRGEKIFTGAFMVNSPAGKPKLEAIVERIEQVWQQRQSLFEDFHHNTLDKECSMEYAHRRLQEFDGMGNFMSYEVVCDLRYTFLLENAVDICTWANAGPGAIRGMCRLLGIDFPKGKNSHGFTPAVKFDFCEECRKLLKIMQQRLPQMPPFEMREPEMQLCEYDKYERVLWNDGRPKRMYNGKG